MRHSLGIISGAFTLRNRAFALSGHVFFYFSSAERTASSIKSSAFVERN
jgi:hypothetical protein